MTWPCTGSPVPDLCTREPLVRHDRHKACSSKFLSSPGLDRTLCLASQKTGQKSGQKTTGNRFFD